jgi:hypothetical protein
MKRCYKCGTQWREEKRASPIDVCDKCNAYIQCCLNCTFYDEHTHNHCKIPTTEWVGDVEKGNYCDEFTFADRPADVSRDQDREKARKTWEELWRDPAP